MASTPAEIAEQAIALHRKHRGKLSIESRMPLNTAEDLSLAYTPGVGHVSSAVAANPDLAYELTGRGRTVAVVSDGSAVLGLTELALADGNREGSLFNHGSLPRVGFPLGDSMRWTLWVGEETASFISETAKSGSLAARSWSVLL